MITITIKEEVYEVMHVSVIPPNVHVTGRLLAQRTERTWNPTYFKPPITTLLEIPIETLKHLSRAVTENDFERVFGAPCVTTTLDNPGNSTAPSVPVTTK